MSEPAAPSQSPPNNDNNNNNNNSGSSSSGSESDEDNMSTSSSTKPSNKPEGIKSSYYHFKSTPAEEAARYAPKPIDPSTLPQQSPPVSGSTWNAAGTWEEKDLSSWAQDTLKDLLLKVQIPGSECKMSVNSVTKCSGDCSIVYSRGKKRIGYDMHATIEWSGIYKENECKGLIDISGVEETADEDDYKIKVSYNSDCKDTEAAEKCSTAAKKAIPAVKKKIQEWIEQLKKHN